MEDVDNESQVPGEGVLLCWGCGEFGQHCHGTKEDISSNNAAVAFFPGSGKDDKVKLIDCGSSHTVVVTETNDVYAWGNGSCGQLGTGTKDIKWEPIKILLYANQIKSVPIKSIACGGRHTFILLQNGQLFSFGNNFYAQLGYDFRIKNYKENQTKPRLLKALVHRPVQQVACGQKHSVFLLQDGAIAAIGSNSHGQLGSGNTEEAVVPKLIEELKSVCLISCGANHTLAVDDTGSLYVWGLGKACGNKLQDILSPMIMQTRRRNIVGLAAGSLHSMALTGNGNIYTWGVGTDGQLGHEEDVRFVSNPKRICFTHLRGCVVRIACGETYSAAVTENGALYMWGRNSHTINGNLPSTKKIFTPFRIDSGRFSISHIACGAWHAACLTGKPDFTKENNYSDVDTENEEENLQVRRRKKSTASDYYVSDQGDPGSGFCSDLEDVELPELPRGGTMSKEKTIMMSIADFYAPTPDGRKTGIELLQDKQEISPRTNIQVSPKPGIQESLSVKEGNTIFVSGRLSRHSVMEGIEQSNDVIDKSKSSSHPDSLLVAMETENRLQRPKNRSKKTFMHSEEANSNLPPKVPKKHVPSLQMSRSKTIIAHDSGPLQYSKSSFESFELPRESTKLSSQTLGLIADANALSPRSEIDSHNPVNIAKRIELRQQKLMEQHRQKHQMALQINRVARGAGHRSFGSFKMNRRLEKIESPLRSSSDSKLNDLKNENNQQDLRLTSKPPLPFVRSLAVPRTVTFVGWSAKSKHTNTQNRHISILTKSLASEPIPVVLKMDVPPSRPMFSSASSWKNERDLVLLGSGNKKLEQRHNVEKSSPLVGGSFSAPAAVGRLSSGESRSSVSDVPTENAIADKRKLTCEIQKDDIQNVEGNNNQVNYGQKNITENFEHAMKLNEEDQKSKIVNTKLMLDKENTMDSMRNTGIAGRKGFYSENSQLSLLTSTSNKTSSTGISKKMGVGSTSECD